MYSFISPGHSHAAPLPAPPPIRLLPLQILGRPSLMLSLLLPRHMERSAEQYEAAINELQHFRGHAYVREGAVSPSRLDSLGRHCVAADQESFHLLIRCERGRIRGCMSLRRYSTGPAIAGLSAFQFLERMHSNVAEHYRHALRSFIADTYFRGLGFAEIRDWAVHDAYQLDRAMLALPIAAFALLDIHSPSRAIAFAADRHDRSSILQRLGATRLRADCGRLPSVYDSAQGTQLDLLSIHSREVSSRYQPAFQEFKALFENLPVAKST